MCACMHIHMSGPAYRYGRHSWSLWRERLHWKKCKEALAAIGGVATDVIDRLLSEFHAEDLYMAYQVFDLDIWSKHISASTPDASARRLQTALRKMGVALGAPTDWNTWRAAARAAINCRARAKSKVSASTPDDTNLENRLAWRAAMSAPNFPKPLVKVIHFYLATWDGTGSVERGLGQDAAIQQKHVGQRARDELDADLYSALLELLLDGPQTESDMFTSSDGVLLLTGFSRACAEQWVLQHGRRFTCYKTRKDKGRLRPQRKKGTDRAVQLLARETYQKQCEMAKADSARASTPGGVPARQTVLGIDRAKLMDTVSRVAKSIPGKKTRKFRAATLAKRAEKQAAGTWCGWTSEVPKPRLGGAAAVEAATKSAATQAVRATLWMSGRARRSAGRPRAARESAGSTGASNPKRKAPMAEGLPVNGAGTWKRRNMAATPPLKASSSASTPGTSRPGTSRPGFAGKCSSASMPGTSKLGYAGKAMAAKFAKMGSHVVNTSLESMIKQRVTDPDSATLMSWLKVVASGGLVKCAGQSMALRPGVQCGHHVKLSSEFAEKHRHLADAIRKAARDSKGKWVLDSKNAKLPFHISKKRDIVDFLLRARRVAVGGDGSGLVQSF